MVQGLDQLTAQHKDLRVFVVVLQDKATAEPVLRQLAQQNSKVVPLTVPAGGPSAADLKPYKLNADVPFTVIVYKSKKATANFALQTIGDEDVKKIAAEVGKIVAPAQ